MLNWWPNSGAEHGCWSAEIRRGRERTREGWEDLMARTLVSALLFCAVTTSAACAAVFDPRDHRRPLAGQPTEIMVLGTPHLANLGGGFSPDNLRLLIERLSGWKPAAIAYEGLSGIECEGIRRNAALYPEGTPDDYCFDPAAAGQVAGMDVLAATIAAGQMLADPAIGREPAQRRRLALLFLAAGERASALVQWLQLPPSERRADDGLTEAAVWRLKSPTQTRGIHPGGAEPAGPAPLF